jgi:Sec-independent protein translocase protein TatA
MIGIGFGEIIFILIIASIVLKPTELPQTTHKIGLFLAKMRRLYQLFHYQWSHLLDEAETQAHREAQHSPTNPILKQDKAHAKTPLD